MSANRGPIAAWTPLHALHNPDGSGMLPLHSWQGILDGQAHNDVSPDAALGGNTGEVAPLPTQDGTGSR